MNAPHEYLTKAKFEELTKELEHLRNVRRKEVAEQLEYTKQLGDLSENAEYHQAREDQAFVEDRISKLDSLLKSATIVEENNHQVAATTVGVGSSVEVRREGKKETMHYTVVGSEEANTATGKLSASSPLGSSLLGKKKNDQIKVKTPGGEALYTIISIK